MSGPRFSPFLAQRRCDLIAQGASLDSPEVRRLDDQLREHDAACALLRAEVQATAEAKRQGEIRGSTYEGSGWAPDVCGEPDGPRGGTCVLAPGHIPWLHSDDPDDPSAQCTGPDEARWSPP